MPYTPKEKDPRVKTEILPFVGRNIVVWLNSDVGKEGLIDSDVGGEGVIDFWCVEKKTYWKNRELCCYLFQLYIRYSWVVFTIVLDWIQYFF